MYRYRFLYIHTKINVHVWDVSRVVFFFLFMFALLCFVWCCFPLRDLCEGDAEEQEHIVDAKERKKNYFYFFAAPQRRKNTSYWCNKWFIVTVSPRHCLWSVFLISKSRANLYGPLSSKTLHRSLALVENSSASQRSVIITLPFRWYIYFDCTLESNKCQYRIIIEFILVGCVLCKQRVSFPANEVISSWIWFNCLNYRNWEYNQKVSISSIFTAWTT